MREFDIAIRSFLQVQQFVTLAMNQPFEILVGNDSQQINGKDFMGMCALDYSHPLWVRMTCSEEEYSRFRQDAVAFLA